MAVAGRRRSERSRRGAPPRFTGERELIVVAKPEAGLRATGEAVASISGANVSSLNSLLKSSGAIMVPLFGSEERVARQMSAAGFAAVETAPARLTGFYRIYADDPELERVARRLIEHDLVEGAYVKPAAEPPIIMEKMPPAAPEEAPPVSPDFVARQLYLEVAPGGIDARYAWTRPGGKGQGVRIIDIEGAWRFSHEDLLQNQGGVIGGTQSTDIAWRNHGTAVVGEFGGDENTFGITGICPLANVRAISIFGTGQSSAKAITDAANALSAGDIILIELHRPGPRFNYQNRTDQLGFIPVEFWPDDFAAIVYATSVRGVVVVEAGGNGAENLDDPLYNTRPTGFPTTWRNPFNMANPQSGAVLVGAGAPPPGTHGRNWGADRSRLDFSNFGSRIDVQGWGREVTTTGYGDLQGGTNEDFWYTDQFAGTSSASPIIVGTVGCMQGGLRAAGKPLLTPATARDVLRNTGSPQQDEPGRPATQRIGNRPNLRQALERLGLGKSAAKDLKDIRKEVVKDKNEKTEVKEKVEIKERIKETKEKDKEKEIKEIKEVKEIREGGFGGRPTIAGDLESRVAALEQTVASLAHFISPELRPDLQASALSHEEDLQALSQELQRQANEAKALKDDKDLEKLRDR
ncbi:MAG TPA: S8 family peptidase [Candidatus Binatia bacterium]|jgi:hypothetical protein